MAFLARFLNDFAAIRAWFALPDIVRTREKFLALAFDIPVFAHTYAVIAAKFTGGFRPFPCAIYTIHNIVFIGFVAFCRIWLAFGIICTMIYITTIRTVRWFDFSIFTF